MDEPTLQLVEQAVASRAPASAPHPIRAELFPRLDRASTIDEVERALHEAGRSLAWLGDALVAEPEGQALVHRALARVLPQMLSLQDALEAALEQVGSIAARKALLAHETLRRFFAECARAVPGAGERVEVPSAARPSIDFLRGVALRLALLVVSLEHLVARGSALVGPLADKAFETSQTFRRAMRELDVDLTPWLDAAPPIRARRIIEAARGFWDALDDEQRRAVGEAWGERVELPPRWPPPSS